MVEKPTSVHMHPKTTLKFRFLAVLISLAIFAFGAYVIWLAYTILKFTVFNLAGFVILMSATVGVLIWLALATIQRTSFKTKLEDLQKYKIKLRTELITSRHR